MVSFPLQQRCVRSVNHLSLIGHRVDPKLIAKSREYGSWVESVGASKSKRGDPVRFSATGKKMSFKIVRFLTHFLNHVCIAKSRMLDLCQNLCQINVSKPSHFHK